MAFNIASSLFAKIVIFFKAFFCWVIFVQNPYQVIDSSVKFSGVDFAKIH